MKNINNTKKKIIITFDRLSKIPNSLLKNEILFVNFNTSTIAMFCTIQTFVALLQGRNSRLFCTVFLLFELRRDNSNRRSTAPTAFTL
jgi:hypothetical protein